MLDADRARPGGPVGFPRAIAEGESMSRADAECLLRDDPIPSPDVAPSGLPDWQRVDLRFLRLVGAVESKYGLLASALFVASAAEAISFVLATTMDAGYHARFTGLSANPFAKGAVPIPFGEHRLRILGPVLAWALGLRGVSGTYVPIAFNIPLLALIFAAVRRRAGLPLSIVFTLLMATTHVTMSSRMLLGYHDSMVFFFATLAMVVRSPLAAGASFFLALFGDPRVALMIPMMGVWTLLYSDAPPDPLPGGEGRREIDRWKPALQRAAVLVAASALFVAASYGLLRAFEHDAVTKHEVERYLALEFLNAINSTYIHLCAFMTFKAGWLIALMPLWLWAGRRPWLVFLLAANLLAILVPAVMVYDFSRALAFCYPMLMLGVLALGESAPSSALTVVATCYAINVLTPFYQSMTKGLWVVSFPLPIEYRW